VRRLGVVVTARGIARRSGRNRSRSVRGGRDTCHRLAADVRADVRA
jgi:hypothetical protein